MVRLVLDAFAAAINELEFKVEGRVNVKPE